MIIRVQLSWKKNGRNSCTGNLLHINVQYLFMKYRIYKGEVKVEYFLINIIQEDYFTKLLWVKCSVS